MVAWNMSKITDRKRCMMTNFEYLRSMTLSDLATYLCDRYPTCTACPMFGKPYCFRHWLQAQAKEEAAGQ